MSDPAAPEHGLPDRALRSALEFAVGIAAAGQKLRPPLPAPAGLKPYLKFHTLPNAVLGKVRAVVEADGRRFTVKAAVVVNAAGVWADDVRALDEGKHPDSIRPAKGVHITVPWEKVRNDIAVVIPVPKDKRSLFVVPWGELPDGTFRHTYIGTTDTDYVGPLVDPQCTKDDIDYVLKALNFSITTEVTADDTQESAVKRADGAMYTAKTTGKNRVVTA